MTAPRLLVLDLDGTTLRRDGTIDPADVQAARRLREIGVQITIATGRLYGGTGWVARTLGVTGSVAVMNGSEHVDVASDQPTFTRYLDKHSVSLIRGRLAERQLSTFVFRSGGIDYARADAAHERYLAIWTEDLVPHDDVFETADWHGGDIIALCALGDADPIEQVRELELPDTLGSVSFNTFSGHRFVKFRDRVEDKGTALKRLAAERGVPVEQTVAVGDWMNDIELLQTAGRSFSMAGALPEVIGAADEVLNAERGNGGGIAEVARKVWGV